MCYFLYGAINKEVNDSDYAKILSDHKYEEYHFKNGTADDVDKSVEKEDFMYRISGGMCDCSTPIGERDENRRGIKEFSEMLSAMRDIKNIKRIYLSKNWIGNKNTKRETVHIQDIDVPYFLANIEENCLYEILMYKKYY